MRKLRFSSIVKFFAIALLGAAATIAAIAVLSSPAATIEIGGGGKVTTKSWDTDNLRYESYNAKSFNIPFHDYGGYSGVVACRKNVADGFFQTDNSVVNDFPRLVPSGRGDSVRWSVAAGSAGNNAGCDTFVAQQNRLAAQVASGVGHVLDENGNLVVAPSGAAYTTGRSASDLNYGSWTAKAASGYTLVGSYGGTSDSSYLARADGHTENRRDRRAISPDTAIWTVPSRDSSTTGNFGASWHGTAVQTPIPGYWTGGEGHYVCSGGSWYTTSTGSRRCSGTQRWVWTVYQTWVPPSTSTSDVRVALSNVAYHLPKAKSVDLCPSLFHPRGEDSYQRIGRSTGRSLTGLSHTVGRTADRFWCRSDLRYERRFAVEVHDLPDGIIAYAGAPASGTFTAYGRLGCYYTATGQTQIGTTSARKCGYRFPMPRCDSNRDGAADREYTAAEIQSLVDRGTIALGQRVSLAETARCDPPPTQASFTADACVTADMEIYENRIVGSTAEPGVAASDRTLAVAAGRTAWDLDVTSPHPSTASPPRDTTSGSSDPDGCADGSEDRADHASSPGGAARKQSPAPSYAASDRTDTAAPPNDADGDIDYSGAARNMAHRYASRVAENTCAAKLAEAEAELSLLEVREDAFAQWLTDYKAAADTNASRYSSYTRTPQQSGSGLAVLRFNDYEANKATYAALLATRYASLSSALAAAKTAYDATTDRSAGSSRAAVIAASSDSGCIVHYTAEITRLKTPFANAETAAASRIRAAQTAVTQTRLVSPAAVANNDSTVGYRVPDISAVLARTETTRTCADDWNPPFCSRPAEEGEECGIFGCAGTWTTTTTSYYTCPGGTYSVAGTVSRSYKGIRSASYSTTYTAAGRSTESTSRTCPSWTSARTSGYSYAAYSDAVAYVMGTPGTASSLPSVATVSAPETLRALGKASLLGNYYLSHTDRANLKASSAADRNTAGNSLSVTTGSVPSGSPQKIEDYQTAYKTAYDTAFSQAEGHMSGTSWDSFDWRYQTSTLAWGSYQEDPATTYSASTATPRDGTGCDLITVAADGSVSVEATRLDYETSSYGKGSVYSTRTDAQRTCKIRRTRTPELLLMYAPVVVSGTDTSKTVDTRLDTDSAASNAEFYYVDYQPTPAAERFKLYDEAEVFAVKASLADSLPVLCYQPGEALVAHVAAKGIDAVNKAVFRNASGFAGGNKKHCYRHPSAAQLGTPPRPAFAFFDDTAHSAMASVNVVWQQPNPKIVSKLGSADDLKMMANTVSLVASAPVAYADSARTSSFYGTYYTFPTDTSTESPSGWDITGHPTLTLASTFTQHQVQAKDTAAKTPWQTA